MTKDILSMTNFVRTFSSKRYTQIIAMRRQDKDGAPELRLYFQPDGMGVCEFGIGLRDDLPGDAGKRIDEAFATLNGQAATEMVDGYMNHTNKK
jgi:hypothetical protein